MSATVIGAGVIFSVIGVEMIGIAAGEAENPQTTIPMAINSFVWRIIIFYVGALFVILAIFPWNRIGAAGLRRVNESLRTGSLGGHPQMPRFEFSLRDADAVMQYLEGIQRP